MTFSFNKQTQIGAAIAGLVAVISFAWFFFFSGGPSLDGVWLRNTDSSPVTYELSGKKQKSMVARPSKRFSKAMKRKRI
ncbi:hypothetical protein SD436_07180 [Streptococcus sp. 2A/TPW/M5]